ncbi:PREDICTED: uncharacterized protein LOC105316199 [Amphimedon queenslandica]|uniref:Uncharacterized protein n=1 Tax=Amphimedon queenslandica TaxID=400682 RepID=A0AAN0K331_AMPQE|nr:PREDICTED: uncharacterized protein LOC105316199 [Amphimedon queenslandica]|eukprot:XP_019863755.1 PREDICTED: uncharacterized protein LOC105316199 [Amphimedon queenslandica]
MYLYVCTKTVSESDQKFANSIDTATLGTVNLKHYTVEEAVRQLNFFYTTILRPVLIGRGEDRRLAEKIAGIFIKALPVETLAQAMAIDAYQYKGSSSGATATDNVVIMTNSDIYRTAQVILYLNDTLFIV